MTKTRGDILSTTQIGHMLIVTRLHTDDGPTWNLHPCDEGGWVVGPARPLFSGKITSGMADQLRKVAEHFETLERKPHG